MPINVLAGLAESLSAVDAARFAAGLHIPNWDFRDWNSALFDRASVSGADGQTWSQDGFRSWYFKGSNGSYSLARSSAGVAVPTTRFSSNALFMSAYLATATVDVENHQLLANCIFTEQVPFSRFFPSHYGKPITVAFTLKANQGPLPTTWDFGTNLVAYLAQFDANHNYLDAEELVFEDDGSEIPQAWSQALATTAAALDSTTAYVQVHIGIRGDGADQIDLTLDSVSMMLNPTVADAAGVGSPDLFIDLATVYLDQLPAVSLEATAVADRRMLDGRLARFNLMKGGPFPRLSLSWWKEDGDTLQKLQLAWLLSMQGLGATVPGPVPLCVDAGLGRLSPFGYYHAVGPFGGSWNQFWTAGTGGYDVGMNLVGL